MNLQTFANML